ncbi:hypothetical protein BTO06_07380 [Tenacibaculum sp. SZ-18]|nr:hypothetical protein BTO06_07380 [Tenacibaculum sp. SZ-18]
MIQFTQDKTVLFDFEKGCNISNWQITNDTVMGGISSSQIYLNDAGNGVFTGMVSTDNNGGFAMTRYPLSVDFNSSSKFIELRVKGDNKKYQLRLKSNRYQRYWHIQTFKTSNTWEIIKIPLEDFYASFRGYRLDIDNFSGNKIKEIAILIGNKKDEKFKLEIDYISVN